MFTNDATPTEAFCSVQFCSASTEVTLARDGMEWFQRERRFILYLYKLYTFHI